MNQTKYVILVSGRGSNMRALVDAGLPGECVGAISNLPDSAGLEWAAARGVPTRVVDHRPHASRESFDAALAAEIRSLGADWIFLAGFMRILTDDFVRAFQGRLINIHPSLLPAFPGLRTHAQALAAGVLIHGATVHFVTPELDAGPAIVQAAVPVWPDDTAESLAARVLVEEHLIYPRAARLLLQGRVRLEGGRVRFDRVAVADTALSNPSS
jgi:phosphoribosylglycinamide formyltransferase-1